MSQEPLIPHLVTVVERLKASGDSWGWPSVEIARVASRRWKSYSRRHEKTKRNAEDARVLDLAKGLQARFEPDIPYTHPSDWQALAQELAEVLRQGD